MVSVDFSINEPIHVRGANTSARALVAAKWAHERREQRPFVILCDDDETAATFASDIETLSRTILGAPLNAVLLPAWEQSLFSCIAPSIRTRLGRINALASILSDEKPDFVVTSLAAASQTTIPPSELKRHTIELRTGTTIESREIIWRQLIEAAYQRVDTVEDPGTFALRGEIIDIYPPTRDTPIRIELFDNTVEQIREFDASTQRTKNNNQALLGRVIIPPAREVLINSQTVPRLRERLKNFADDAGIPRSLRDPVLAQVQEGTYAEHCDAWTAFAYPEQATLWSYISSPVIINDQLSCLEKWNRFVDDQKKSAEETTGVATILPKVESLYDISPRTLTEITEKTRLFLHALELESQDNATHYELQIKTNADLNVGTRHTLGDLEPDFRLWIKQGFKLVAIASTQSQAERIRFLLEERGLPCSSGTAPNPGLITIAAGSLSEGFRWISEGLIILVESEIIGSRAQKKSHQKNSAATKDWSGLQALSDLAQGDTIVHLDHGIGLYQGLVRLGLSGAQSDFLLIEYANKDRLYLPVYRLNVIQKHVGAGESVPLDRLGSQAFARTKDKVREAVKKLAIDLVQLYAERHIRPGLRLPHADSDYHEFEARFPYDETPDQQKAISQILHDLEAGKVMDRLVCGDVGYGKTEVAMRAAFRAASNGKQVAVLVPTTILAQQHEETFRQRFKDYAITIEALSRFKSSNQQKDILASLAAGKLDIVIGTHRLLSRDIRFHDLGLIIVDEEHRFGVEHKERLKTLKTNTHVLTLTATPIPRTLHMALSGLRDISLINTPPIDRLPIKTYVSKFDEALVRRAIDFELARGGQVFFLHNRVQSIYKMSEQLKKIAPQAQIVVAHGQMSEQELERAMLAFYQKQANVLLCTSIVESGLDLPNANTIIIDRADMFGLAQLYQIRGRVGRGQQRAHAYLLLPPEGSISDDAKRRLEVIQRFVELGSGFNIASHDLEIRGGGDLLGPQQSGHIGAVGFDLYTELLEEAIRELRGKPLEPEETRREPEIKAPFPAYLPEEYVPDVHQRLSLYRRLSASSDEQTLTALEEELHDRFGELPLETQNLIWIIKIKQLLKHMGVESLTVGSDKVSLIAGANSKIDPARAIAIISAHPKQYQLLPDSKLVAEIPTGSLRDLHFGLESLLMRFCSST